MEIHFKCYKNDSSKQLPDTKRKVEGEDILGVLIKFGLWPQAHSTDWHTCMHSSIMYAHRAGINTNTGKGWG